jgi:hypothetical protein
MVNAKHTVFILVGYNCLRNHSLSVNALILHLKKGFNNAVLIFYKKKQINEALFDLNKPIFEAVKRR